MKTKQYIIVILSLMVIFGLPVPIVSYSYRDRIIFDPVEFTNDYLDFMLGLLAMGITFWVANIYWSSREKQNRILQARRVVTCFFYQLRRLVAECNELLTKACRDVKENQARDQRVLNNFGLMRLMKEGLLIHYPEEEVEQDERLTQVMIEIFWARVAPVIDDLSRRQAIRGEPDGIGKQLKDIEQNIEEALVLLGNERSKQRSIEKSDEMEERK